MSRYDKAHGVPGDNDRVPIVGVEPVMRRLDGPTRTAPRPNFVKERPDDTRRQRRSLGAAVALQVFHATGRVERPLRGETRNGQRSMRLRPSANCGR